MKNEQGALSKHAQSKTLPAIKTNTDQNRKLDVDPSSIKLLEEAKRLTLLIKSQARKNGYDENKKINGPILESNIKSEN